MQDGVDCLLYPQETQESGWNEKHDMQHGRPHKSDQTHDYHYFNKDGIPIKNRGTGMPHVKEKGCNHARFALIVQVEFKNVLHKQSHKPRKCHTNDLESDNNSHYNS